MGFWFIRSFFFFFITPTTQHTHRCHHLHTFPSLLVPHTPLFEAPVSPPPPLSLSPEVFLFLTLFLLPLPPPPPSVPRSLCVFLTCSSFYLVFGCWMAFYSLSPPHSAALLGLAQLLQLFTHTHAHTLACARLFTHTSVHAHTRTHTNADKQFFFFLASANFTLSSVSLT